jgi:hypothetical protein
MSDDPIAMLTTTRDMVDWRDQARRLLAALEVVLQKAALSLTLATEREVPLLQWDCIPALAS